MSTLPLIDRFGRIHESFRISVTDRCNIRCQYCMSDGPIRFLPRKDLLSYEQIVRVVEAVAPIGLNRLRLTGGEPLVRADLHKLIRLLKQVPSVHEIALTTNAMLLANQIDDLLAAGLDRINISLDTLREETFQKMSRREGIDQVLAGIASAVERQVPVRLNAVVLRDVNFDEVVDLASFALQRGLTMRFIEFMPLDQDRGWHESRVVRGSEIREVLQGRFGALIPVPRNRDAQPSYDFKLANSDGTVGFIDPVSHPFCNACDRLRMTAEGKIRNCLFGQEEWDIKSILESGFSDETIQNEILQQFRMAVSAKHAAHGIADDDFVPPHRAMYQIGG